MIHQADVVRVDFGRPIGGEAGYERPAIVLQRNELNASRLATVLVVPLTSNLAYAEAPGNVRLRKGEANLTKPSVAQVALATAVDRSQVLKHVGAVSRSRFAEVVAGVILVIEPES